MNVFKFLSVIMTAISQFTKEVCDALTTSASAANNCAKIAESSTGALLNEIELENEIKLLELKVNQNNKQIPIPLSE